MAQADDHGHMADHDRRDVLYLATGAFGAVGVAAAVWPLIDQMNPSASVLALSTIEVEGINDLEPGQQIKVTFLGSPVFIRRMSETEIAEARDVNVADLPDGDARNPNQGGAADLSHRLVDPNRDIIVMSGVCTHLGCIPVGGGEGDFGGWFCPCHGSHYDTAGRIRKGPAPENLHIPVARFLDENTLKLG